jgi:hypothetical protein
LKNILSANDLLSPQIEDFIMQDVEKLLSTSPSYVNAIAELATEARAKIDRLVEGEGRKKRGRPKGSKNKKKITRINKKL